MDQGEIPKLVEAALQRREEELTRVKTEKRVETLWRSQAAREENDRIADLIQQYQAGCVSLEFVSTHPAFSPFHNNTHLAKAFRERH